MENLADCIGMWLIDYKKNSAKPATYDRLWTSKKLLERSMDIFSHSEQQRLMRELQTMRKPEYAAAILMLEAGLRVGEVLALEWDDILWDQRAVRISKTLVRLSERHGETFVQHSPKSRSSLRTLPLSKIAMESLRRLLNFRELDSPYLFCSEENRHLPLSCCALKYRLKDAFRKINVKQRPFRILQHTFASNCYKRGCNVKILSKILGRRDASVTHNVYIHLFGNDLEEMRKIIE